MGKRLPDSPGKLSQYVSARRELQRARAAAPLAADAISRRYSRKVLTDRGRPIKDVLAENSAMLMRVARELRDGAESAMSTDSGAVVRVPNRGELMHKMAWQKMPPQTKKAYLDYIASIQPGATPEEKLANGAMAVKEFSEVMDSELPPGLSDSVQGPMVADLAGPEQQPPDILVPKQHGGRKMVPVVSEDPLDQRTRAALPPERGATQILGSADKAADFRKYVDSRSKSDRGELPDEVQQQEKLIAAREATGLIPVTRQASEEENLRKIAALEKDIERARKIPELRQSLNELLDARMDRNFELLGGTEPGEDLVTVRQRVANKLFESIKESNPELDDASAMQMALAQADQLPAPDQLAFGSFGDVPDAPINASQQSMPTVTGLSQEGEQIFGTRFDPTVASLTPDQRRAYIARNEPFVDSGPSTSAITDPLRNVGAEMMAGRPDSPSRRVGRDEDLSLGMAPGGRILSLAKEIDRLSKDNAVAAMLSRLEAIKSRTRATGGEPQSFVVRPFGEKVQDTYNVMEFSDSPSARYNRKIESMLAAPVESMGGLGADPSGEGAILARAKERIGSAAPKAAPQRREVVPFDLEWALPELTDPETNYEMLLKAVGRYDAETLSDLIVDRMNITDPDIADAKREQLIPYVDAAIRQRDEGRRLQNEGGFRTDLVAPSQEPPPPFAELTPFSQQLEDYRSTEFTDLPLFSGTAKPFEPRPGFSEGNIGAYGDRSPRPRPQQLPASLLLDPEEANVLNSLIVDQAEQAFGGRPVNIESAGPGQYLATTTAFGDYGQSTPKRIINADAFARQLLDANQPPAMSAAELSQELNSLIESDPEAGGAFPDFNFEDASELAPASSPLAITGGPLADPEVMPSPATTGTLPEPIINQTAAPAMSSADDLGLAPPAGPLAITDDVGSGVGDAALSYVINDANVGGSVQQAMQALAAKATPQAQAAVQQAVAAGQPVNVQQIAQQTGSTPNVIRALQVSTGGIGLNPAVGPVSIDAGAFVPQPATPAPAAATAQAAAPAAKQSTGRRRAAAAAAAAPATASGEAASAPAPAPQPAGGGGPTLSPRDQVRLEQLRERDNRLEDELIESSFQRGNQVAPETQFVVPDNSHMAGLFNRPAPPAPPPTWMNLPSRSLDNIRKFSKSSPGYATIAGLGAAGTIAAFGQAGRRPQPMPQDPELTSEEQKVLQDFLSRGGLPNFVEPMDQFQNPGQTMQSGRMTRPEDSLRRLLPQPDRRN